MKLVFTKDFKVKLLTTTISLQANPLLSKIKSVLNYSDHWSEPQ